MATLQAAAYAAAIPAAVTARKELNKRDLNDRLMVEKVGTYMVYCAAVYTHLLALYMQPCTGLCGMCFTRLKHTISKAIGSHCPPRLCTSCLRKRGSGGSGGARTAPQASPLIFGDNCVGANHTGLMHITKDVSSEIVYASFENSTEEKPFTVFLNHTQGAVVIAVRGTLSLEVRLGDAFSPTC
jgi:hypothetical protein